MEGHCFSISLKPNLPKTHPISSSSTFFTNKFIRSRERLSFSRVRASVEDGFVASMPEESFYELLGISEKVGFSEIKQAYKQMARKYHPDVSPPDQMKENTRRFILVQEAYETLSDPRSRALYDRDLARGLHLAFSARRRFEEVSFSWSMGCEFVSLCSELNWVLLDWRCLLLLNWFWRIWVVLVVNWIGFS